MAHIRLNTHPSQGGQAAPPVVWGARDPKVRGPVVGTVADPGKRNAIGVHAGSYGIYRALAIAAHELKPGHKPDLTNTAPAEPIGPFESWFDPKKIVSLDPWGHTVAEAFAGEISEGVDIPRLRVGVIFGGKSAEHDVSLKDLGRSAKRWLVLASPLAWGAYAVARIAKSDSGVGTVFWLIVGLDALTAGLALFVLKPKRTAFLARQRSGPASAAALPANP